MPLVHGKYISVQLLNNPVCSRMKNVIVDGALTEQWREMLNTPVTEMFADLICDATLTSL